MNKWKHTINIKQHLGPDTDNEAIVKAASGIVQELQRLPEMGGLEDLLYDFKDIAESTHDVEDNEDLLYHFNTILNDLYDFGDYYRIWMGL